MKINCAAKYAYALENEKIIKEKELMIIKYAAAEDIAAIAAVEAECFPPAEAATEKEFIERVRYYGNHFWLMYEEEKLIAFVDGFVTDESDLTDEMYKNAAMHDEKHQMRLAF